MNEMENQLKDIGVIGDETFRRLEYNLVSLYRHSEKEQEPITTELIRLKSEPDPKTQQRATEVLAMVDHVHDPLISAGALLSDQPAGAAPDVPKQPFRCRALSGLAYLDRS